MKIWKPVKASFSRAGVWLAANACGVWFFGHSHHARVWRLRADGAPAQLVFDVVRDGLPARVTLRGDGELGAGSAVNVGSVGLPFRGKGPASATIYDADADQVDFVPV